MDNVSRMLMMRGGQVVAPPGEKWFEREVISGDPITSLDITWVVPPGVFSISAVLVGPGGACAATPVSPQQYGNATRMSIDGTLVLWASGGGCGSAFTGTGGSERVGNIGGGNGGYNTLSPGSRPWGGGGAGGYSGDNPINPSTEIGPDGVGGGGGTGGRTVSSSSHGVTGGGVGLLGLGENGAGTSGYYSGEPGSGGAVGSPLEWPINENTKKLYGGGGYPTKTSFPYPGGGGCLRYINNLAVSPGQTIHITIGGHARSSGQAGRAGPGAARIIWPGNLRQFPSTRTGIE